MKQQHAESETEQKDIANLPVDRQSGALTKVESTEADFNIAARQVEELGAAIRRRKWALRLVPLPATGAAAGIIDLTRMMNSPGFVSGLNSKAVLLCVVLSYASLLPLLFTGIDRLKKAAGALAGSEDLSIVGVMAEALSCGEGVNSLAASALIRLLPRIRREHNDMLTTAQQTCLRTGLRDAANRLKLSRYNPTLAIAIIRALEQIGCEADLPLLNKLASRPAKSADQGLIAKAAETCRHKLKLQSQGNPEVSGLPLEADINEATELPSSSLSQEAVEETTARLRTVARLRRHSLVLTAAGALTGTSFAGMSLACASSGHPVHSLVTAGMLMSGGVIGLFATRGLYTQRNLTQALMQTDDLRIIGTLAESASSGEISGATAALVLTPLLLRLKASDAHLLDAVARDHLNRAMHSHFRNTDFVMAVLTALQQIGDKRSIGAVTRAAQRADRGAKGEAVRVAAAECLEYLQMRAAQSAATQTLLRASSANPADPDVLLRAVDEHGKPQQASGELLRTTSAPIVFEEAELESEVQSLIPRPRLCGA